MGINLRPVMTNMTIFRCKVFELVVILTISSGLLRFFLLDVKSMGDRWGICRQDGIGMRRRYGAALIMSFITVCSHFDYKFCSVVWFYTSEQGTRRAEGWSKCRGAEESGGSGE